MANISGYLSNIKNAERGEDVRDSIINALQKINDDNPSIVKPLNITSNGTYAGEGGIVYNPVTVNVPEGAASALTLTDKVITENGEYEADDGEAYRSVTVDVPQEMNDIMEEKVVTENGEYTALLDGYDGYAKVTVNVQQGNTGPHTVRFHDASGAVVQTVVNVPYGGGCVYSGPTPTSSGMRFVGFNPNPSNVKTDLDCYPKFVNYAIGANQIEDTWETIVDNILYHFDVAQEKYKVGDWKMLELTDTTWSDLSRTLSYSRLANAITNGHKLQYKMMLAGYMVDKNTGNNGYAKTTWVCTDIAYDGSYNVWSEGIVVSASHSSQFNVYATQSPMNNPDYYYSVLPDFYYRYNHKNIKHEGTYEKQNLYELLPDVVKKAVVEVVKYSADGVNYPNIAIRSDSVRLFVPSMTEIFPDYDTALEHSYINYGAYTLQEIYTAYDNFEGNNPCYDVIYQDISKTMPKHSSQDNNNLGSSLMQRDHVRVNGANDYNTLYLKCDIGTADNVPVIRQGGWATYAIIYPCFCLG